MSAFSFAAPAAPGVCRHCGDPCAAAAVSAEGHTFCCRGCASVFALLQESGLGGFYTCETPPGVSQRRAGGRAASRFAALDDPAVAAALLEFDDGAMAAVTLSVPDLHCASCLWLLERLWRLHPGIVRADADLMRRTVHIWFRPAEISLRAVAEQLAAAGYEPVITGEAGRAGLSAPVKSLYLRLAVAGFAFGNIMIFSIPRYANGVPLEGGFQRLFDTLNIALAIPVLLFSASGFFGAAWRALKTRHVTLDVPVALGLAVMFARSVADIATGAGEGFMDSFTGLVFFLLIGRLLQHKAFDRIAFDRSFRSFLPLSVLVETAHGPVATPLDRVREGDRIVVRPHEIVPADACLNDGANGSVDYAFVTGESSPVSVAPGDLVRAGGRAAGRTLHLTVRQRVSHSQLAALWNNPAFAKPKRRWLTGATDTFGVVFTIVAVSLAAAGAVAWWPDARMSLQVATAVLIIACPCAITLAAPITLGTAMEMLGRRGLYLKHASVALDLARTGSIVFDKTGTLTSTAGTAGAHRAEPVGLTTDDWRLARRLASESVHPVSRVMAAWGPSEGDVRGADEVAGGGLRGVVDGRQVVLGAPAFVARETGAAMPRDVEGPAVAIDGAFRGWVRLLTPARPGIEDTARALAATHDISLMSGDRVEEAARWQPIFGRHMAFAQSPAEKLAAVEARQARGERVLMIGDGLNDAGALAAASVGMAVSDETACIVPACDAVIRGDRLTQLPALLRFTRRARQIVIACFALSIVYNVVGLSLALSGLLTPLVTAILMPVSSLSILALGAGGMRWYARELGPAADREDAVDQAVAAGAPA